MILNDLTALVRTVNTVISGGFTCPLDIAKAQMPIV